MSEPSPSLRHPVLLSMWALLAIGTGFGLSSAIWFVVVFLVSPFVAIATFAKVSARRDRCARSPRAADVPAGG